jgi:hypothetical protein
MLDMAAETIGWIATVAVMAALIGFIGIMGSRWRRR